MSNEVQTLTILVAVFLASWAPKGVRILLTLVCLILAFLLTGVLHP